uniref:Secreted protein n=1 Tax=Coccolithus braarudii TaxID=221442 RepID=A0A7S0Q2L8_9EUKA|mmetsp:Transcript_30417/g.65367  ORF Transcript_30417/g.65367 Transcript_30417/m.65367 type:complete len:122 (+) Transcript_30417:277-642(+)
MCASRAFCSIMALITCLLDDGPDNVSSLDQRRAELRHGLRVRIDGWTRIGSHDEYKVVIEHVALMRSLFDKCATAVCVRMVGACQRRFSAFRALHTDVGTTHGVRFGASRKLLKSADSVSR